MHPGVLVRGIRPEDLNKLTRDPANCRIQQGFAGRICAGAIRGCHRTRLADQLSLRAGDNMTLVAPDGPVTAKGRRLVSALQGRGGVRLDMSEYDSVMVFLPLAEAQAYFNRATT